MKKYLLLVFMFLLVGMIGTASALTIGNAIIDRDNLDGADNIAFIDPTLVFTTAGTLQSFSVYAKNADGKSFAAQIYRYTGTASDWELVYHLPISATGSGALSFAVSPFNVQAGDVVGWWFGAQGGVIPYDVTGTDDVEWTNWRSVDISAPSVGVTYSFDTAKWAASSQKREYSISATVPEPATMILLGLGLLGLAGARRKLKK